MPAELRFDTLTREWVNVVGHRQARPNLPSDACPFCVGGLEAPEPYDVRWFENRWPALAPGSPVDVGALERAAELCTVAVGACEVILFSPEHDASLSTLPVAQVRKVVDLWAARTDALMARPEIRYVLVFENRGAEVGATIDHPHGQIYAYPLVPPVPERELANARDHGCPVCDELIRELAAADRVVHVSDTWAAYVPFASAYSYGLRVVSRRHVADFRALDGDARDGLAAALVDVLGRYDRLWPGEPFPYLLWFHQAAKGDDGAAHLHAHLAPPLRAPGVPRYVASGELGSGLLANPVVPEDAAAALRAATAP
jgi:UDPglucose--hexose-1-phosphate uridylyltransferase